MHMFRKVITALDPSHPAKTAMMILLPALLLLILFKYGVGAPLQLPPELPVNSSALNKAMEPILNRSGVPSIPSVNTPLTQKASDVANKSMDIADQALDSVNDMINTGNKVIDFGADLIDRTLPSAPTSTSIPATP